MYRRTCNELKIEPVAPTCARVSTIQLVFHLLGLPGITRYAALFSNALRLNLIPYSTYLAFWHHQIRCALLQCSKVKFTTIFHLLGLSGITRYAAHFSNALRLNLLPYSTYLASLVSPDTLHSNVFRLDSQPCINRFTTRKYIQAFYTIWRST